MRQTSIDVYYQIKDNGLLSKLRLKTYSLLVEHGAMTANELMAVAKRENPTWGYQAVDSLTKRLSELRDLGCINEIGVVDCSITNRKCIKWDINGQLPNKYEKPLTNKEKLNLVAQYIKDHLSINSDSAYLEKALEVIES